MATHAVVRSGVALTPQPPLPLRQARGSSFADRVCMHAGTTRHALPLALRRGRGGWGVRAAPPDIGFGVIGLGRMGALHAEHLGGLIRGARLVAAAVDPLHLQQLQAQGGAPWPVTDSVEELLKNSDVEAVVIASSSSAHGEHIAMAAARGLAIFCEKPLADSLDGVVEAVKVVEEAGVPFQIGFQRRFDAGYARARELIAEGAVGRPELFRGITSDHIPPVEYLRTSGGLFWDLGVHDFDAARFLMADEISAVQASGAIMVESRLAEFDDVDYGVVTLRFRGGAPGVVQNSWRAPWGYEIRAEVCGSEGRVVTELDERAPVRLYTAQGFGAERHHAFLDRFREAYRSELQAFVDAVRAGRKPSPDAIDGLRAVQVADAATRSRREGGWVDIPT
jgi:myo-inositol 2-dehydrogenase/D-chiro-inositol 1-dehydrogenase